MKRTKELIFNTIIIGLGKFGTKILTFLLLPLYTSCLTTEEYGLYDLLTIIALFLTPVITLLMEEAMFRFLIDAKNKNEKEEIISNTIFYIIISTISIIVIVFIIFSIYELKYKYLFIFYLICSVMEATRNALTRGIGKIKIFSISSFFNSFIMLSLKLIFLLVFNYGVEGLLTSYIIATTLVSLIVFYKVDFLKYCNVKKINKNKMKEMAKYSLPLVPNSISWSIINLSDRIIISYTLGVDANGIYSVSHKFPSVVDSIYSFFYTAWKESASKTLSDENPSEFYNLVLDNLTRILFSFVLIILSVLPFVFDILIKGGFSSAYIYIPILMIAVYFSNMSGYYGGIFIAYKETKIMGTTTVIAAIINIIINILCIWYIGIWAAAISTLLSNLYVYYYRKYKIKKYVDLKNNSCLTMSNFFFAILNCIIYYSNNLFLQLITFVVTIAYCIYINRKTILFIKEKIVEKI